MLELFCQPLLGSHTSADFKFVTANNLIIILRNGTVGYMPSAPSLTFPGLLTHEEEGFSFRVN